MSSSVTRVTSHVAQFMHYIEEKFVECSMNSVLGRKTDDRIDRIEKGQENELNK